MIFSLAWLACGTAPDPAEGLVIRLSAFHEVPSYTELATETEALGTTLSRIAKDGEVSPLVRDRAWQVLATAPDPALAVEGIGDASVPAATRLKLLMTLARHHPKAAGPVAVEHWCHEDALVRRGARTAFDRLPADQRPTRPSVDACGDLDPTP
ncbi:MAG: hypothetical protein AAGA48_20355 [Myxococcota bacterium]